MAKLNFEPTKPLYTSDTKGWPLDQLESVLSALHATGKPLVIFIHGRGIEPNKSLRGATFVEGLAVHKLERGYDVGVLMFNWDSAFPTPWFNDRSRALGNTPAAADQLTKLLSRFEQYFFDHPERSRPVLLVHSMGSIVLQKTVEAEGWPQKPVFKHVVITQPDADDVGHSVWVSKLAAVERVFVTQNSDDKVLKKSKDDRPAGSHALGLGTQQPVATNAAYVDLTNMGALGAVDDDHEVFGKGAMNGQLYVCQFLSQALRGEEVQLQVGVNVEIVHRNVVHKLVSRHRPAAPCLSVPSMPTFED